MDELNKVMIQQANSLWSVYTDTGQFSMADETLLGWDLSKEEAERQVEQNDGA